MSVSLSVTLDPTNRPPRVALSVSGAAGASVTVTRQDAAGNSVTVRTANPAIVTAGAWVGYDYEAPFGDFIQYTVRDGGNIAAVVPLPLDIETPWLIHPGIPDLSQPIILESRGDLTRPVTNRGVHTVMGRSEPVVITDGKRNAATFDLTVHTESLADEAAMLSLLGDTSPLLLQIVYPTSSRKEYWWVSVGDVTTSNIVDYFANEYLRWVLPCTVTSPPTGLLQAQWTWAGLLANYATWQDVVDSFPTWADVITNSPS